MKPPSAASRKKVTAENLAGLGADRLAEILVGVAETRPDLKRRLRMELAAEQGPEHLVAEIDKRLAAFETSRGQVTWRQRPAFVRDLDALRGLIADRLAKLEPAAASERIWRFMETARPVARRIRSRDEAVTAVYGRAAGDLGRLLAGRDAYLAANTLSEAITMNPQGWAEWLPQMLANTSRALAAQALNLMGERRGAVPGWLTLMRHLADAAGNVEAYRATYGSEALETPAVAVEIATRYLATGEVERAGEVLRAAAPKPQGRQGRLPAPDYAWETAWIEYLQRSGDLDAAQAVRWASFERTLVVDRVRAFTQHLPDFEDVEAESRAFAYAAQHDDFRRGLRFLMTWPALVEAADMILARPGDIEVEAEEAELWAGKLRARHPAAAHLLLRRAAASAFRRREFKACDRLSQEAETITVPS